ncbi:MAG: hypothetical protein ABFC96_03150 [Thermoguttaceae bacterium]
MNFFDNQTIQIPCPECGHEITETIGRLKNDPDLPCPGCGITIKINAEKFREGFKGAEDALANFERSLGKLGK